MVYDKFHAEWENLPAETTPITAEFLEHVETALDTQDNRIVTLESEVDGHVIHDEAVARAQRPVLNFTGSGVAVTDNAVNNRTDVTIGGGGGGHTIQDEGSAETDRGALNFLGSGVSVADDAANNRTNVTIPGAAPGSNDPDGWITIDTGSIATAGTAINNAIAALPSGGGTILIPAGTWTIDTPVLINKNGVIIQGTSMLASSLVYNPAVITAGAIRMADTTQRFCTIRDLHIDATGTNGGTAIDASYFVNSQFERLRIGEGTARPTRGIVFDVVGTYYNTVRNCTIAVAGIGSVALRFINQANSNWADNCRIHGDVNTIGVDIDAATHTCTLAHMDCEGLMAIGIRIGGHNNTLICPYIESLPIGLQLLNETQAFSCFSGHIATCDVNIDDQGAIKPVYAGVWLQYVPYNYYPTTDSFKRTVQVSKDPGADTVSALGTPAPVLTGHSSVDSTTGAFMDFATSTTTNNTVGAISPFTVCRRDWDPRVDFRFRAGASLASIRVLLGLFSASPDAVPTPETIHGAWFRYDTSVDGTAFWRCVVAAGAAPTVVTTTFGLAINEAHSFRIQLDELPGKAVFFIDDTQVARITTTAVLPATSQLLGWGMRVTTLTTASKNARWGVTQIQHD